MPPPTRTEATPSIPSHDDSIVIPGLLDIAVEEYSDWQQLRVSSETFRDKIKKARDFVHQNCLDLKQIFEDQDPG